MENSAENSTSFTPYIQANQSSFCEMFRESPGFWISSAVTFSLFLFGLPLNAWILWLILKATGGLVASDIFTLNLAAMEICYSLAAPLYGLSIYFCEIPILVLIHFFDCLILTGQPLFLCCICVERYLAVVHPFTYLKYKPVRYRATCSGAVWMLAVSCSVCNILNSRNLNSLSKFTLYSLSIQCVALFTVGIFCSFSILKALRRPGPGEGETEGMNLMKKKAFTVVLIIQVVVLLNIPLPLILILSLTHVISQEFIYISYGISFFLFMIGAFVQPLLYLTRAGKLPCM